MVCIQIFAVASKISRLESETLSIITVFIAVSFIFIEFPQIKSKKEKKMKQNAYIELVSK